MIKNEISSKDTIVFQKILIILFSIIQLIILLTLVFDFNVNTLYVWILVSLISVWFLKKNLKTYFIYYDNSFIYIENAMKTKRKNIELFDKVLMTTFYGNYNMIFKDEENYNFKLIIKDNWFKQLGKDSQFYAVKLTNEINLVKNKSIF
ncbi:hypothetical protein [Siphonobacter sp. SORGH_AS_1065]|uniref:hypothetical protein n=1 Tax=Siphonobacter sp. SORGH_AS_1065 TaxID=3041795 RepID=UPI00278AB647|nr:hypothetical protein [Siphonobacter sp. SORGH_AS_1065]MDQ1089671.1 hypothetical protein [Siphonobacter sp. SORGH_AS_1065]